MIKDEAAVSETSASSKDAEEALAFETEDDDYESWDFSEDDNES